MTGVLLEPEPEGLGQRQRVLNVPNVSWEHGGKTQQTPVTVGQLFRLFRPCLGQKLASAELTPRACNLLICGRQLEGFIGTVTGSREEAKSASYGSRPTTLISE